MTASDMEQALHTFVIESRELLEDMEAALLAARAAPDRGEFVHALFRAAHTIKGSAGLFGLEAVVGFTHVAESLLDKVRGGEVPLDDGLIELLLGCHDHLGALIDAVDAGDDPADPRWAAPGAALAAHLRARMGQPAARAEEPAAPPAQQWHISLRFGPGVLRNGMDPLAFLRYLRTLGRIVRIVTLPDAVPVLDRLEPTTCHLGFEIAFESRADKAAIERVFEFVLDDCTLRILPPDARIGEYTELIHALPEEPARVGEMLVQCGSITPHELQQALATQQTRGGVPPIGQVLVEQGKVQPAIVDAALAKQQRVREVKAQESRSVRVDADKLDRLIDLVGELIIAAAGANTLAREMRNAELVERNGTLASLVEQVRDSALQLRMVKIGATFARFERVVHDVARELGKDIALAVSGEDTELDKTVVEKIGDPLTHLVRNAMDHGIEPADVRAARAKPARGTVQLNAFHDSGSIVIQVSDDGGGIDRDRVLAKAVERGLVDAGRQLTDTEVFALLFEPGFSTAPQVTNLSGRGVGMDVVRRNIEALRGSVELASRPGLGTTVTVRLPLTLAIINGFQLAVGKSVFVVPLEMVEECVTCTAGAAHDYIDLRGQVLPFVRLREHFALPGTPAARQNIVVVRHGNSRIGLVVDTLLGEAQTVIKPLARMFGQVRGISGSSILGNGDVALILDVPALIEHAEAPSRAAAAA
ncbi:MAG TPA: chemotaxis protein CheA [Albitalea sp.]